MGVFSTAKWILIIVVVIAVLWIVLKAKRFAPEFERMVSSEFGVAKKIFSLRDAWNGIDLDSDNMDDGFISESDRTPHRVKRSRKSKNSKPKKWKREEECREFLEEYFDKPFPSARPKFLRNPETGRPLELDGYNPSLNLAFEYNGKQHYKYPNNFHKSKEDFSAQVRRDKIKHHICKQLEIDLIAIPYKVKSVRSFIKKRLRQLGY